MKWYEYILFVIMFVVVMTTVQTCCGHVADWLDPAEGAEITTMTGFAIQPAGLFASTEKVEVWLSTLSTDLYGRHLAGDLWAVLEGEIMLGYRTNEGNGLLLVAQPVLTFPYQLVKGFSPYLKLMAGISWNSMSVEGMGLPLNFTPSVGAGARFQASSKRSVLLEYRLTHLSNSGLSEQNVGINMHTVLVGTKW